ncbi:uncharacterized protein CLUP02_09503 [Colletotrichum lupini]|uniref:Uncharacterized protein n=1 Tax=Colletotrichum lupini TaxID=145971 RepID=A0A9Q8WIH1_9PEZI|nr:uncharacterized protein CLUP02_09503 [Colletotrichum lupini]UQC84007.1 hypothetical protein CLUP02_09503 [Colletotrichum lupini]
MVRLQMVDLITKHVLHHPTWGCFHYKHNCPSQDISACMLSSMQRCIAQERQLILIRAREPKVMTCTESEIGVWNLFSPLYAVLVIPADLDTPQLLTRHSLKVMYRKMNEGHGGSYGSTREKGERRGEQVPVHRGAAGGKPAALVETWVYVRTSIRCPASFRLMSAYKRHLHSSRLIFGSVSLSYQRAPTGHFPGKRFSRSERPNSEMAYHDSDGTDFGKAFVTSCIHLLVIPRSSLFRNLTACGPRIIYPDSDVLARRCSLESLSSAYLSILATQSRSVKKSERPCQEPSATALLQVMQHRHIPCATESHTIGSCMLRVSKICTKIAYAESFFCSVNPRKRPRVDSPPFNGPGRVCQVDTAEAQNDVELPLAEPSYLHIRLNNVLSSDTPPRHDSVWSLQTIPLNKYLGFHDYQQALRNRRWGSRQLGSPPYPRHFMHQIRPPLISTGGWSPLDVQHPILSSEWAVVHHGSLRDALYHCRLKGFSVVLHASLPYDIKDDMKIDVGFAYVARDARLHRIAFAENFAAEPRTSLTMLTLILTFPPFSPQLSRQATIYLSACMESQEGKVPEASSLHSGEVEPPMWSRGDDSQPLASTTWPPRPFGAIGKLKTRTPLAESVEGQRGTPGQPPGHTILREALKRSDIGRVGLSRVFLQNSAQGLHQTRRASTHETPQRNASQMQGSILHPTPIRLYAVRGSREVGHLSREL